MKILKKKSLIPTIPDDKVELTGSTTFMSFESAIRLYHQEYPIIAKQPTGYIITEQGITIKYD